MGNTIDPNKGFRDVSSLNTQKKQGTDQAKGQSTSTAADNSAAATDASVPSEKRLAVEAAISATPDIDMDRVDKIKQAIADGNYPIDNDRIAEKFIQLEGLLGD